MNPPPSSSDPTLVPSDASRWFAEQVQPHESKLRTWLRARFPTLTDLDDIVQEAYCRVLRAKDSGKVQRVRPYLFATARNAALDFFRHERVVPIERVAEMADLHVLDQRAHTRDSVAQNEDLAMLAEAIDSLPARCREVLVLRKLHGLSQKEIAAKLGISENTVAAQASLGVRRCMEYFRLRGVGR